MSLIYFDGMDQYVPVPAPSASPVCRSAVVAAANITTVPTDPVPFTLINTTCTFVRINGDDRVWRISGRPTAAPNGNFAYYQASNTAPFSALASTENGLQLNTLQPVSACSSITVGFKMKYASTFAPAFGQGMLLAAFTSDPSFQSIVTTFGVVMEANNRLYIRQLYSAGAIQSTLSKAFPANTFTDSSDGYIGTCNFVYGSANTSVCIPPIDQLAANTVEVQYTAAGKISVWVNNMFAGTATFVTPVTYVGTQYINIGQHAQAPSFGNGSTANTFCGVTDLYLLNGLGTKNNTRLGKVKVVSRLPVADAGVQFVRPDTSNSNASVVSQSPVLVTPALIGSKAGDTDLYSSTAFNFTNEAIIATAITTTGYKTDPSGNDIAPVLNVTGTNYIGNTNTAPISLSLMKSKQHIYELNPKTGLPFTKSELDATTFGVTVVAPS